MTQAQPNLLVGELSEIPCLAIEDLRGAIREFLTNGHRLVSFFGSPSGIPDLIYLNVVLASAQLRSLKILRTQLKSSDSYHSLTPEHPEFHCFERECHEQYGVRPIHHPWLKPIRYSTPRAGTFDTYPFYQLEGKEVHEVGVGPIHAGVIEPGHFRFMCFGETIHHLEIQLGYQHRALEQILLKHKPYQLAPWIETIAGDSSIAHTWAYCMAWENLCGMSYSPERELSRGIALELERVAMHLAGLAGMATDIAFLPGGATYGRLRTAVINTSMRLCGSRFGRGWLRPGEVRSILDPGLLREAESTLQQLMKDLDPINDLFRSSRTVQHRLKGTGHISSETVRQVGFVGMVARCAGVSMDLRGQFAGNLYRSLPIDLVVENSGDCWARALIRIREIDVSLRWLLSALALLIQQKTPSKPDQNSGFRRFGLGKPKQNSFAVALMEGWRGEVMHYLETNAESNLAHYKVQDPSLRNWFALALAVRGNEISDFPICNKSFDLSYCGQDL